MGGSGDFSLLDKDLAKNVYQFRSRIKCMKKYQTTVPLLELKSSTLKFIDFNPFIYLQHDLVSHAYGNRKYRSITVN